MGWQLGEESAKPLSKIGASVHATSGRSDENEKTNLPNGKVIVKKTKTKTALVSQKMIVKKTKTKDERRGQVSSFVFWCGGDSIGQLDFPVPL